jgi:hypothetical protein
MYAYGGTAPNLTFFAAANGLGSEGPPGLGYNTGGIFWHGWTGSGYGVNQAQIVGYVPAAWTPGTSQPMYIQLKATPIGGVTSTAIAMQIMGGVVIGAGTADPGPGNLALSGVTAAQLPGSAPIGTIAYLTDANGAACGDTTCTTWGTTVGGGGGTLKRLIWFNGGNWSLLGR